MTGMVDARMVIVLRILTIMCVLAMVLPGSDHDNDHDCGEECENHISVSSKPQIRHPK